VIKTESNVNQVKVRVQGGLRPAKYATLLSKRYDKKKKIYIEAASLLEPAKNILSRKI